MWGAENHHVYICGSYVGCRKSSCIYTRSVVNVLINLTKKLKNYLDSSHFVAGVFVDLEKDFDTVNHKILCEKLNYYGFRGRSNQLLSSYLENRKQYVSINGFDSETNAVICGVPQGSSLGPLLFLIYINIIDIHYLKQNVVTLLMILSSHLPVKISKLLKQF